MKAIMGFFHVSASLTGPTGRTATLDLLVDTGATLLVVPRSLADQLEILALRTQPVQIAGGRKEVWPVAEVRVAINGREVTTPCFIAPGGPALLGAVALESLFLAADPVAKRLVPVEGFVGLAARRESSLHILFSSSQNDLSFLQGLHHVAQELSLSHRGASAPPHARYARRPSPGALPRRKRSAALSRAPSSRGRAAVARNPTLREGRWPPGGERPRALTGPAQRGSCLQLLLQLVE